MKKILLCLGFLAIFFFATSGQVQAVDLEVTCGNGCSPSTSPALFESGEVWYPAKFLTKTIKITNSSLETKDIAIKASSFSQTGDADLVFRLQILKSGNIVWDDTMRIFGQINEINLGRLNPRSSQEYSLKASMSETAGNEYQGKKVGFDLNLGFLDNDPTASPNPTPQGTCCSPTTEIPGPGGASGGPGFSSGGSLSSAASSSQPRVSVFRLETDQPEILGTQTSPEEKPNGNGVLADGQTSCPWWLPLLILEFVTVLSYIVLFLRKRTLPKTFLLFPILLALATFLVDNFIAHLFFTPNRVCEIMWFISPVVGILPALIFIIYKQRRLLHYGD